MTVDLSAVDNIYFFQPLVAQIPKWVILYERLGHKLNLRLVTLLVDEYEWPDDVEKTVVFRPLCGCTGSTVNQIVANSAIVLPYY